MIDMSLRPPTGETIVDNSCDDSELSRYGSYDRMRASPKFQSNHTVDRSNQDFHFGILIAQHYIPKPFRSSPLYFCVAPTA
jgi:hypothetical protein